MALKTLPTSHISHYGGQKDLLKLFPKLKVVQIWAEFPNYEILQCMPLDIERYVIKLTKYI